MQNQARRQQIGGKMDYIHKLRTGANPGEEVVYHRDGGKVTKRFVKKKSDSSGQDAEKDCGGAKLARKTYFGCKGGKARKSGKKCYFGGSL